MAVVVVVLMDHQAVLVVAQVMAQTQAALERQIKVLLVALVLVLLVLAFLVAAVVRVASARTEH